MNREKIKRGFNFIAPYYDFCSNLIFGKSILSAQSLYFNSVKESHSILILGGGTGKILLPLAKEANFKSLTFLDISPGMIDKARHLCISNGLNAESKIEFMEGSTEAIPKNKMYDAIITPFVLDCFSDENLEIVMRNLDQHLVPGGMWLFSDFHHFNSDGQVSFFKRTAIKMLYLIFNLFCYIAVWELPHFKNAFNNLGLIEVEENYSVAGLIVTRTYQKPTSIR
ncbi:MAG: hypothetical protein COB85_02745 [Bacteroidetes bacterium]|nr:MAG: hypothetical protein COB85_02745 [Bacteroidota bacterium]